MTLKVILAGFCLLAVSSGAGGSAQVTELPDDGGGRQGGDTCLDATVIDEIPYHALGTTMEYNDDFDEDCGYGPSTSPDVVYLFQPTYDRKISISLCHPGTNYDTKLYVYENACLSPPIACNDDDCAGGRSQLLDVALTTGNVYYIVVDGYGGDSGDYELTIEKGTAPLPECPADSAFSQPSNGAGLAVTSELSAGMLRFENYEIEPGVGIETVRCWGVSTTSAYQECVEDPPQFVLKFFPDEGGYPGSQVCEQTLEPTVTDTELLYYGYKIYQYDFVLDPLCPLSAGWVSVQGAGDPDCWFFWMSSPESDPGDGRSVVDQGAGYMAESFDLSLCLNGVPLICPGDLNCDGFIDFGDINPFVLALSNWPEWKNRYPDCPEQNADINQDGQYGGQLGFGDINPFVALIASGQGQPIPCE